MAAQHASGSATADRPVFVDRTGTRRRWFAVAAAAAGVLLIAVIAGLVTGFVGVGPGQLPLLPGLRVEHNVGRTLSLGPTSRSSAAVAAPPNGTPSSTVDTLSPTPAPIATPTTTSHGNSGNRPTHTPPHTRK